MEVSVRLFSEMDDYKNLLQTKRYVTYFHGQKCIRFYYNDYQLEFFYDIRLQTFHICQECNGLSRKMKISEGGQFWDSKWRNSSNEIVKGVNNLTLKQLWSQFMNDEDMNWLREMEIKIITGLIGKKQSQPINY